MELWTSGGTGRNPRENRHLCAISPSTLRGRTLVRDETATTIALSLSYSCPSRGNLLSKECTPASALSPATTSRGAITRARLPNLSAQKTPAANATSAFDSIKEPAAEPCRLQPQRLLQRAYAPAAYGDFLFHAVQREQQRAAGDRFDFLNHGKVHQVPAMHTEEPVAVQTLL